MATWFFLFKWLRPSRASRQDEEANALRQPLLDAQEDKKEANDFLKAALRDISVSQPFSGNQFASREWLMISADASTEFVQVLILLCCPARLLLQ